MDSKVNFFIIGAGKAGTTSVAMWLAALTDCCMSEPKEPMFFCNDPLFEKGIDWYHASFFGHYSGERIVGDASPGYTDRDQCAETAGRIYAYNPNARLLYLVRNPLARCLSEWRMWAALEPTFDDFGKYMIEKSKAGFEAWMSDPAIYQHQVLKSRYGYQLQAYDVFPEAQKKIVFLEDVRSNKSGVLQGIADYLEIDAEELINASSTNYNTAKGRLVKSGFRRTLEKNRLWQRVKQFVPARLKATVAKSSVGGKTVPPPRDGWNPALKERFIDDIREDAHGLLQQHGKSADFWGLN